MFGTRRALLRSTPPWVLNGASVDLDFAHGRYYGRPLSAITTSRASVGTASDLSGNWYSFGSNVPRITNQGLLVEEGRTNSIRNNSIQGALAGLLSSGGALPTNWSASYGSTGLTAANLTIGSPTTVNGVNVLPVTVAGMPTGSSNVSIVVEGSAISSYGQTWTGSVFGALVSGSQPGSFSIELDELNSGAFNAGLALSGITLSSVLTRASLSYTNVTASTNQERLQYKFAVTSGVAVNFTFYVGWPQLENNSLINSTVASATVQAGGTGGTSGTAVYQVGGGTGTAATLNVTVSGGAITTINSVASAGSYSVLPPSPAALTYVSGTGTGVTGATINLTPTNLAANALATSPIVTTSVAVARAADVITLANPPSFGNAYTLFAKGTPSAPVGSTVTQTVLDTDDGSGNRVRLQRILTSGDAAAENSGGATNLIFSSWPQSTLGKIATSVTSALQAGAFDGTAQTIVSTGSPASVNNVRIGLSFNTNLFWNGYIAEVALWPTTALSSAQLQAITSGP